MLDHPGNLQPACLQKEMSGEQASQHPTTGKELGADHYSMLHKVLSGELRVLGDRLRKDVREDFCCLMDEQAARLQRVIEQAKAPRNHLQSSSPCSHRDAWQSDATASFTSTAIASAAVSQTASMGHNIAAVAPRPPSLDLRSVAAPDGKAGVLAEIDGKEVGLARAANHSNSFDMEDRISTINLGAQDILSPKMRESPKRGWMESSSMVTVLRRGSTGTVPTFVLTGGEKAPNISPSSAAPWPARRSVTHRVTRKSLVGKRGSILSLTEQIHCAPANDEHCMKSRLKLILYYCVASDYFDYVMGAFLMLNALVIGLQVDHMSSQAEVSSEVPGSYQYLNVFFCVVFALELLARSSVKGTSFWTWRDEEWRWNWFDTVVVCMSSLEEILGAVFRGSEVKDAIVNLSVLRLLRLGRVARLARMARLIPELKSMTYLIMASMSSFVWTCVMMTVMMYCFAVYFTELATEMVMRNPESNMSSVTNYWGNLGQSILSLFQAMTGGDDWRNFVEVFNRAESSYVVNVLIFSVYMAFATLVMLNLVTGVFVESAQRIMQEDRSTALMKLATKVFRDGQIDSSASLSKAEFDRLLTSHLLDDFLSESGLQICEADRLFHVFDVDDSGDLTLIEFVAGCIRMTSSAKSLDVAALHYTMKVAAKDTTIKLEKLESELMRLWQILPGKIVASLRANELWKPPGCGYQGGGP